MSTKYGSTNTLNPSPVIYSYAYSNNRRNLYIFNQTTALGSPRYLEGGKYYYMEAYHVNQGGSGMFHIEVEVPHTDKTLMWQRHEVNHI